MGTIVFDTPEKIEAYRAIVIANALRLYAKTGMKVNTAYTPKAMMAVATKVTGKKFKARAYVEAAEALDAFVETVKKANQVPTVITDDDGNQKMIYTTVTGIEDVNNQ